MRLTTNKTKNGISYYIIRSVRRDGKRSSEVVERLGTEREIMEKYHCTDANKWAKAHLDELNQAEAEKQSLFRCGRIFSFLSISRIPITLVTFSFRRSTMIFACQTSVERFQKNIRFPMTLIPSFHVLCMRGSSIRLQNSPAMSSPPICSNHRLLNCIRFIVPCLSLQTNPIPSRRNCMKQAGGWSNGRPESCTMTVPITFLKRNVRKA